MPSSAHRVLKVKVSVYKPKSRPVRNSCTHFLIESIVQNVMACDNLYVVVVERTFFDPRDPAGQVFNATVPATCTNLKAAEEEAKMALFKKGYETESFLIYNVNDGCDQWKHGDDTIVYAETQEGEVLKVAIDMIPNTHGLRAGRSGRVEQLPYHILQTVIE